MYFLIFMCLWTIQDNNDYFEKVMSNEHNAIISVKISLQGLEQDIVIAKDNLGELYRTKGMTESELYQLIYDSMKNRTPIKLNKGDLNTNSYRKIDKYAEVDSLYNQGLHFLIKKYFINGGLITGKLKEKPYVLKILFDNKILMIVDDMTGIIFIPSEP